MPINTLKIDKAFIDDIATSAEDRHMTQAIITIAHNLGLKVVAEGVEHESQRSNLRHDKCEMLQGYLYSKPLNAVKFERLLKENHELQKLLISIHLVKRTTFLEHLFQAIGWCKLISE